eukprot:Phypoly_transcript_16190.p1 GENE.Phypoly_transcript_16190~~Phypoly_transcript_16190.p1  ORF type:complete len:161 (+),score=15.41 Phypoly_transcript_16190:144-626(+)
MQRNPDFLNCDLIKDKVAKSIHSRKNVNDLKFKSVDTNCKVNNSTNKLEAFHSLECNPRSPQLEPFAEGLSALKQMEIGISNLAKQVPLEKQNTPEYIQSIAQICGGAKKLVASLCSLAKKATWDSLIRLQILQLCVASLNIKSAKRRQKQQIVRIRVLE